MGKVIGIDLGTTNSAVAILEGGEPTVIPNAEGSRTSPSVVAFTKEGERLVGNIAKRQSIINPERTISSIKRKMGTKYHVKIDDKKYSPQEISAMIIQKLKDEAEDYLGEEIKQVVVTVPAYFDDSQRQATKDAGKIAGLEVLRIINEPTAAALAYGLDKTEEQTILVFDLGGGTFDVSILELGDGVFEVKSTSGNTLLGGDDFDDKIIDHLVEQFQEETDIDLADDKSARQRLKEASEKAKVELSGRLTTNINLPYLAANEEGPKHLDYTLTRAKFEELTSDLVKKCAGPTRRALKDASLKPKDIDKVILVGGSTRIPAVQKMINDLLKKNPDKSVNPDECVALGAAIQAGVLTGEVRDVLLLDVTPLSLGIETLGGVSSKFIPRNTTIPVSKTQIFSTAEDNQPSVEVHVLQGEREMAADNKTLGRFHLVGIPPAPRGVPQVEVKFDIDANGILNVSAKDLGTGKEQKITITASSGLSKDDVAGMVEVARKYAKTDKKKKKSAELRNQADALIYSTEKAMEELGTKLNRKKVERTKKAIKGLKSALKKEEVPEIRDKVERLTEISQDLFTALYADAARREMEREEFGPPPRRDKKRPRDREKEGERDAIDIEYKEVRKKPVSKKGKRGPPEEPEPPSKRPPKEKPTTIKCPKCKEKIEVTSTERPLKIKCPSCGAKGTLKDDGKKEKAPPPPPKKKEKPKEEKKPKVEKKPKEEKKPKVEKKPKEVKKSKIEREPTKEEEEEEIEELEEIPELEEVPEEKKKVKKEAPPPPPPKPKKKEKPADEDYKPLTIPCSCGGKIIVSSPERPIKIQCPDCGKKGTLKK